MQNSGVDDDIQISALDVFYEMDGRQSRYIEEVLDGYAEVDVGDLKRSELNESLESMTCLNALEGNFGKVRKVGKGRKVTQNIVMNEKFVKTMVMSEEFVQNTVMNAKLDPKVVMDLSILKIGGWNNFTAQQPKTYWKVLLMRMNRGCSPETEIHSSRHNTWRDALPFQINT